MKRIVLLFFAVQLLCGVQILYAQVDVTFQVDIREFTENGTFDPERDHVELIGDQSPLSVVQPVKLSPNEENSSLYTTTVTFSEVKRNKPLQYQFRVMINYRYRNEDLPRTIHIPSADTTIDAMYFNSYAW
ncbi:MAG: hypothetical protein GVY08_06600 [Bacteroidetes bacterium]|nr:hypothetical protein [Bacteroidota bacterium]